MTRMADELLAGLSPHLAAGDLRVAVLGLSGEGLEVLEGAESLGASGAIFDPDAGSGLHPRLRPWGELADFGPDVVAIASDEGKESLLSAAASTLDGTPPPHCVLTGLGHQERVQDPLFEELEAPALVPSYATGHPYTRAHLYDCLRDAATHGRSGAIVELGAFKGGTSVWLAKAARGLGLNSSPIIAFDYWDGFPPRRSLLDLYEHPRCVFRDLDAVRAYTSPHNIELVPGDIFETVPDRLADEPVLLAFVDTDNYSGTRRALEVILPNLALGGAIVLDHYFTTADYVYTVGERIAAREALDGSGLLNLRGTGVFLKTL
jgi:O-methyltransferase